MTTRATEERDQTSPHHVQDECDEHRRDHAAAPDPAERDGSQRRRPSDGFSIGAPLTAAFIGGFLVIENLADANEQQDSVAATSTALISHEEGGDTLDGTPSGEAAGDGPANGGNEASRADDVPAGTVDESVSQTSVLAEGAAPGIPAAASLAAAASLPDDLADGGSNASLNFFNINLGDGTEEDAGAIVEDDILRRDKQVGSRDDDVLVGTDGDDAISGGSGDDVIHGEGGRDLLNGNDGNDQLFGGAGEDKLKGGSGDDFLDGGADYDNLLGGSGDDVLVIDGRHDVALDYDSPVNSGEDLLIVRQGYADDLAEDGIDAATFVFSENLGDPLHDGAAAHRQQVAKGIEHITLEGNADHDILADSRDNRLTGNDGSNIIRAGEGDDLVHGGSGHDDLRGGSGDDKLVGGAGDDRLKGGLGQDEMYGEAGDDVFVIGLNDSAIDTVFDHQGANRLVLDGVTDQTVEASLLGNDLYVTVDQTPVAMVSDYVGHENALAGIDFGQGLKSIDTLLVGRDDLESTLDEMASDAAEEAADDLLAAHLHLTEPTVLGDPRTDQRLDGSAEDDWLSGFDGKDVLFGKDGNDILEGGDGVDQLVGGAGDDRYVFSEGERGIDKIKDTEGRNLAELKGFDDADIEGAMLGDDLAVLADGEIIFTVDDFSSNQAAFHGVQAGNKFIPTEDLFA